MRASVQGCMVKTPLTLWSRQAGSWGCPWIQSSICSCLRATQTSWRRHSQVSLHFLQIWQPLLVSSKRSSGQLCLTEQPTMSIWTASACLVR